MKQIILFALMLFAACSAGCSGNANLDVTHKIFEAFNAHDWPGMLAYYADDAVFEDPAFAGPVHSHAPVEANHRHLQSLFPDIKDEIQALHASGDHVIVEFIARGTSADGKVFSLPICSVLTFKNGKVVRDATYYNNCAE